MVLFVLSTGVGYAVGAQVRGGDGATSTERAAPPATTLTPAPGPTEGEAGTSAPPATEPVTAPPETAAPETTTTTEPGPRRPDREHPLRVVLAGDSVMAGLAPPVKAALEADGTTTVRFILTPSILRDPTVRFTWNQQLAEFDPEVVVMFVGTWESGVVQGIAGQSVDDPGWQAQYERAVLDPWIQLITSRGASVLWLGNPTVGNDDANHAFTALNRAFRDLPTRWPSVQYVDTQLAVNGPLPGYHDTVVLPNGMVVRTRQLDGLHLCADGAALLSMVVTEIIANGFKATISPGWETGPWRYDKVYPAASCPPV